MLMRSLMSRADARGARSTALHALQWALALLLAAIPPLVYVKAPEWLLILLIGAVALVLLVFLASYVYLLLHNPDALRSEQFSLSKMALEKGLIGDDLSGLAEPQSASLEHQSRIVLGSDQGTRS